MLRKTIVLLLLVPLLLAGCQLIDRRDPETKASEYRYYQLSAVMSNARTALDRYGYVGAQDAPEQLDGWTISSEAYPRTTLWTAQTETPSLGQVTAVFSWSGAEKDGMMLAYFKVGAKEHVDQLAEYR